MRHHFRIHFILQLTFLMFGYVVGSAQEPNASETNTSNPLAGLTVAGPGDMDPGTPLMLDPMNTPMYDEALNRILPQDFMTYLMSNEYVPEPYLDKDKLVKAIVLRKATEEEQQFMRSMQEGAMPMDGAVNVSVGTAAKDFNVTDIKGKKYTLSELKGKVVVMSFWFVECKPCVMEMPELNALVQQFKDDEVVFIGVATNDKKQLKQFLKTTAFDYHIIPSAQTLINEYSISAFPTNIVIDQNGIIQYSVMGIGPNNSNNLMNTINELLKK